MMIEAAGRPNPPWKATVLRRSRSKLGVVLVEILLALAGLAGIAALLQSKQVLPNESDLKKALDKLSTNPVDPDANTVAGKYLAFVKGDYAGAMPYLVHSQDKTLKSLAEHELDPAFTDNPEKKVGMADEWVAGAKKFPQLTTTFYDRASQWYIKAWPDLSDLWKMKARQQGKKIGSSRPIGAARKAFPTGWVNGTGGLIDGSISHTGSYSAKLAEMDAKVPTNELIFYSDPIQVTGKKAVELSAYVLSDQTENPVDSVFVQIFDLTGTGVGTFQALISTDVPFWRRVTLAKDIPSNIAFIRVGGAKRSKGGTIWTDDFSVKLDGKEVLKNGSFEER